MAVVTYQRLEELPCTDITVETSKPYYTQDESSIPVFFHRHGCDDGANENVSVYEAPMDLPTITVKGAPRRSRLFGSVNLRNHVRTMIPYGHSQADLTRLFWSKYSFLIENSCGQTNWPPFLWIVTRPLRWSGDCDAPIYPKIPHAHVQWI